MSYPRESSVSDLFQSLAKEKAEKAGLTQVKSYFNSPPGLNIWSKLEGDKTAILCDDHTQGYFAKMWLESKGQHPFRMAKVRSRGVL